MEEDTANIDAKNDYFDKLSITAAENLLFDENDTFTHLHKVAESLEKAERRKYLISKYKDIQKKISHLQIQNEKENQTPLLSVQSTPKIAVTDETRKKLDDWKKDKKAKEVKEYE